MSRMLERSMLRAVLLYCIANTCVPLEQCPEDF